MTKAILTFLVVVLASTSFAAEGKSLLPQKTSPAYVSEMPQQARARHVECLASLEKYFNNEVSSGAMKEYLSAQYEITVYRIFASILAQRHEQIEDINLGVRNKKEATSYTALIKERLVEIGKTAKNDPDFQAARKSFNQSPLSVSTFIKLAPFLEKYVSQETATYDELGRIILRLDKDNMKMLDLLASLEKTTKVKSSFIDQIEALDASFIFNNELGINIGLMILKKIKPNMENIKLFFETLKLPVECSDELTDLSIALNCYSCMQNKENQFYTLTEMSDEISQTLFNSLLSRDDLKNSRERGENENLYYIGTDSPWGNYRK